MRPILLTLVVATIGLPCPGQEEREGNLDSRTFAGIVYDLGGSRDGGFNESASLGLAKAREELGVRVESAEPIRSEERRAELRRMASAGCRIVLGIGFIFTDDVLELAPEHPDVLFVCIDMIKTPPERIPRHVAGIQFRDEEGAFLAGAVAALRSRTGKIGFVGGMRIPLVQTFEAGYRAGARHVATECDVLVDYAGEDFHAFGNPEKGKALALSQYERGAEVVYHAAGTTGLGIFEAARETGKLAIGTDFDQRDHAPGCVLASVVKRIDVAVYESIRSAKEGRFEAGIHTMGVAEGAIELIRHPEDREIYPDALYGRILAIRDEIAAGRIVVPRTP